MTLELENEVKSNVEGLELYSDNYPFRISLRIKTFENESEYKRFLKNCEKTIRGCLEYKSWRNYITDVLGVNTCMVTDEKIDEVSIEVHHHIPSLFVLVKALVNRKIEREEEFSTFDIALESIELHFANKIGYLTLLRSMHEKLHNGYLSVPISKVKGDYQYFIREFSKYLDDDDLHVINSRLAVNESNCSWSRDNYPTAEILGR